MTRAATRIIRGALLLIGTAVVVYALAWGALQATVETARIQQEVWDG